MSFSSLGTIYPDDVQLHGPVRRSQDTANAQGRAVGLQDIDALLAVRRSGDRVIDAAD